MNALRDPNVAHVLLVSFTVLLFLGSLLCVAVGLGLIFRASAMLRLFAVLNRWVSTRRLLKPVEVLRTSDLHVADPRRRWVTGLLFVLGGGYVAVRLGIGIDTTRVVSSFAVRSALVPVGVILVETMRWSFVVLCTGAAVLGVVLLAWPDAWARFESHANRWYSTRKLAVAGDAMNLTLDRWVELYPVPAGIIVLVFSLAPMAGTAVLLFGR